MIRTAGLRGRLQSKPEKEARFWAAGNYATLAPAAYPVDATCGITEWQMDGNGPDPTLTVNGGNPLGDCGPCAFAHSRMATACWQKETETPWTADQVANLYLSYTGGQDSGVDLGDFLLWLFNAGQIEGFVKLDPSNRPEIDAWLQATHAVLFGVSLCPDADTSFEHGEIWDVSPTNQPDPNEGHCILLVKSTPTTDTWVTWGALQVSTKGWTAACADVAYAILTDEMAKSAQFSTLIADLKALGGTVKTAPQTQPQPSVRSSFAEREIHDIEGIAERVFHKLDEEHLTVTSLVTPALPKWNDAGSVSSFLTALTGAIVAIWSVFASHPKWSGTVQAVIPSVALLISTVATSVNVATHRNVTKAILSQNAARAAFSSERNG